MCHEWCTMCAIPEHDARGMDGRTAHAMVMSSGGTNKRRPEESQRGLLKGAFSRANLAWQCRRVSLSTTPPHEKTASTSQAHIWQTNEQEIIFPSSAVEDTRQHVRQQVNQAVAHSPFRRSSRSPPPLQLYLLLPCSPLFSSLTPRCLVLFCSMIPKASIAFSSIDTIGASAVITSRTGVRSGCLSNAITRL